MKIVIVGAGFAGFKLARRLDNKRGFEVVLLDKVNYHQFQPLFYQVATAGLDASNISFPLRKAFHHSKNVHIRLGELREIKTGENKIVTSIGDIDYDLLVLATGAETNFFNNAVLKENAFPMKSTVEALQLRHRLILNFEHALSASGADLERLLNIVIVGGGPTGVELAGAIAELKRDVLPYDYPELDFSCMKVYLLEGQPKTLATMSEQSSKQSQEYLEELGVNVITNTIVKNYDGDTVTLSNGNLLHTELLIWAAGVIGNVPPGIKPDFIVKGNRINVDRHNRVEGLPNVFALGDVAAMKTEKYPNGHPQLAAVAIQQAKALGNNLLRGNDTSRWIPFEYNDKGTMATVGRNLAVVDIPKPKLHFGGWFAWIIWMSLHLFLLLGVKNKIFVFLNWMSNYFTRDRSLRLIFPEFNRTKKTGPGEKSSARQMAGATT